MARRFAKHLATIVSLTWCAAGISQEPFAVIIDVRAKGKVLMKADTSQYWREARNGTWLNIGDSVQALAGAKATIVYHIGAHKFVANGQACKIDSSQDAETPSWWQRIWEALTKNREDLTPMGASRGEVVVLLSPRAGKLLSAPPTIIRTSSSRPKTYRVRIFKADSDELVWQTISRDTLLVYPENAPALIASQEYRIHILPKGDSYPKEWERGAFMIASESERRAITNLTAALRSQYGSSDSTDVTTHFLLASFFLQNAFYTEAYWEIQRALILQPNNRAMQLQLLAWYRAAGLPSLFESLREKLVR